MPNSTSKAPKARTKRVPKSLAFKRIKAGLEEALAHAQGEPGLARTHKPMTPEQRAAETPDEKALRQRYLDAMPGAPKWVSPEQTCGSGDPLVAVERIKDGGRILTSTDETGKTTQVFLSRTDADAVTGWLKETDEEVYARLGLTRKATFADIRKALSPDGPPPRKTLKELKESIANYIRKRHGLPKEVFVRRDGRAVILEPVDEWSPELLALIGTLDEDIERPPQTPIPFPAGWDQARVQAVVKHYDDQTEDEAVAELETVPAGTTRMDVPTGLVQAVRELIAAQAAREATGALGRTDDHGRFQVQTTCPQCGAEMHRKAKASTVKYLGHERKVKKTLAWWCSKCDEAIFDYDGAKVCENVYLELKAEVDGVLGPKAPAKKRASRPSSKKAAPVRGPERRGRPTSASNRK